MGGGGGICDVCIANVYSARERERDIDTQMNRRSLSEVMMQFEEENIPVMRSFTRRLTML